MGSIEMGDKKPEQFYITVVLTRSGGVPNSFTYLSSHLGVGANFFTSYAAAFDRAKAYVEGGMTQEVTILAGATSIKVKREVVITDLGDS